MSNEEKSATVPGRDKQAEEDLWERYGAERGVWSEPMLAALERGVKGNKRFSLIDKVWSERTLGLAWEKVKSNAGACGVDGITIGWFEKDSQKRLLAVKEQIKAGTYQPEPIKRVEIPKPGSAEKRPLGIPTVTDRVVQAATRMVIEPIFEHRFARGSYGFRPGRGCKEALREVDTLLKAGTLHVVDVDIRGYFDTIPHEKLMARVREQIADGRVLTLIEKFLKQGILNGGDLEAAKEEGTPQGGVISPLLSNLYLDPLDWLMEGLGYEMIRYADDIVVLCQSQEEAQAALGKIQGWMEEAGLTLHPEKTRRVNMNEPESYFDFLGYRFMRSKRGRMLRLVRPKSLDKLRESLREQTRRSNGKSMEEIVRRVNRTLGGWFAYFKHSHAGQLEQIDGWIRGRLRSILRSRNGMKGRGRGKDHQRWPNRYFEGRGLFCLKETKAFQIQIADLLMGAKL